MNENQMAFRCPDAQVVGTVRLENYRLAFRGNGGGRGVATILPEKGSYVDGVLWRISARDEQHLDQYEGFPNLYGKETVMVRTSCGEKIPVMAYTMNAPYRDIPAFPSWEYLNGIVTGCQQHDLDPLAGAGSRPCPPGSAAENPCPEKAGPGTVTIQYMYEPAESKSAGIFVFRKDE